MRKAAKRDFLPKTKVRGVSVRSRVPVLSRGVETALYRCAFVLLIGVDPVAMQNLIALMRQNLTETPLSATIS